MGWTGDYATTVVWKKCYSGRRWLQACKWHSLRKENLQLRARKLQGLWCSEVPWEQCGRLCWWWNRWKSILEPLPKRTKTCERENYEALVKILEPKRCCHRRWFQSFCICSKRIYFTPSDAIIPSQLISCTKFVINFWLNFCLYMRLGPDCNWHWIDIAEKRSPIFIILPNMHIWQFWCLVEVFRSWKDSEKALDVFLFEPRGCCNFKSYGQEAHTVEMLKSWDAIGLKKVYKFAKIHFRMFPMVLMKQCTSEPQQARFRILY